MCILHGIFQVSAVAHLIPFPIYQTVRPLHFGRQIKIFFQKLIISRSVIVRPIYPRSRTGFDPRCILHRRRVGDIGYQRRFHDVRQRPYDKHPPRRLPSLSHGLLLVEQTHTVKVGTVGITQERASMSPPDIRLRHQHKYGIP